MSTGGYYGSSYQMAYPPTAGAYTTFPSIDFIGTGGGGVYQICPVNGGGGGYYTPGGWPGGGGGYNSTYYGGGGLVIVEW